MTPFPLWLNFQTAINIAVPDNIDSNLFDLLLFIGRLHRATQCHFAILRNNFYILCIHRQFGCYHTFSNIRCNINVFLIFILIEWRLT